MTEISYSCMLSPLGQLLLAADEAGLRRVVFGTSRREVVPERHWRENEAHEVLAETRSQLEEYFAGRRTAFSLALAPRGTDYQRAVWSELQRIPYGTTISYGELAKRTGNGKAARAVGAANGRNPIPIIIPCHRVIGADGSLTGFGGGLKIKRRLLRLEGALPANDLFEEEFAP